MSFTVSRWSHAKITDTTDARLMLRLTQVVQPLVWAVLFIVLAVIYWMIRPMLGGSGALLLMIAFFVACALLGSMFYTRETVNFERSFDRVTLSRVRGWTTSSEISLGGLTTNYDAASGQLRLVPQTGAALVLEVKLTPDAGSQAIVTQIDDWLAMGGVDSGPASH